MYIKNPISTIYYTLELGLVTSPENHGIEYLTLPVHLVEDQPLSNGLHEPTIDGDYILLGQSSFDLSEPGQSSYQTSSLHHTALYPQNFDTNQPTYFPYFFPAPPMNY